MTRRLLVVLAAAVLVVATTLSPAGAYQSNYECIKYDGDKTSCFFLTWRKQDDGTGVYLQKVFMDTPRGCNLVLNAGGYREVYVELFNPRNGQLDTRWNFGTENSCFFDKILNEAGTDKYGMMVNFHARAAGNHLWWQILIKPDGSYEWKASHHYE